MKFANILFFTALVALATAARLKQTSDVITYVIPNAVFNFIVDDLVQSIKVVDREGHETEYIEQVYPCDRGNWKKMKKVKIPIIRGETIVVKGMDAEGGLNGFAGTMQFIDLQGYQSTINTNTSWTCNEKPAVVMANYTARKVHFTESSLINDEAKIIWDNTTPKGQSVTCKYTIPC